MTPRRNVELKARYPDLDAGRATALRLECVHQDSLQQVDTYFQAAGGRLKLREIFPATATGSSELIWYARPDDLSARTSRFHVVPVTEPAQVIDVLAAALGIHVVVRKTRELFLWDNVRIHLDDVEDLGRFLEFEAVLATDQDETEGYDQLRTLEREFGIPAADIIGQSYADLLTNG